MLLVHHYVERLGLAQIIERALRDRGRAQLPTGEVVSALIANRLCAPSPLYDIAGWACSVALQELFRIPAMLLNDDRLGRALEAFCPRAEEIRGAAVLAAIERFGLDAGRLHLDLTALRVCGAYEESSLVAKGWNAERRVERQVKVLQATISAGIPLYVDAVVGRQKSSRGSGGSFVDVVQATEGGPGAHLSVDRATARPGSLVRAIDGSILVIARNELDQHGSAMPLSQRQDMVEALAA